MSQLASSFGWNNIKGDKTLWGIVILISLLSVFPVYSASSNLEYIAGEGTTMGHVIKHLGITAFGLGLMWTVQIIRYEYLAKLCLFLLWCFIGLLFYTSFFGTQTIDGASASRWIKIPIIGMTFQPSSFTYVLLIIYLCRYMTRNLGKEIPAWKHILYVFGPILLVFFLVAKDNGSTALMIVGASIIVLILGGFGWKYILGFITTASVLASLFLMIALNTNWIKNNRVDTWKSRIETFMGNKQSDANTTIIDSKENYQIAQATAALVHGGFTGKGPGKSAMKQMLPQSVSDFIFAIVVEEYGFLGAFSLFFLYIIILFRIIMIANKVPGFFGPLLVISMGVILFIQILVNVAVTLSIIPVTGQPLPLISYGGSAMLSTYFLLGVIINVSKGAQILNEEGLSPKQTLEEINDIA